MKCLGIFAVTGFVMMVVVGCAQGAGNTPSGSTDLTTSAGRSGERATTEQTTYAEMRGLQCPKYSQEGAVFDYAQGIGEKASPVEQARRRFSKRIEEGDTVEITDDREAPPWAIMGKN